MRGVLLVHAGLIPHYRVPILGYLSRYLKDCGFDLFVTSDGINGFIVPPGNIAELGRNGAEENRLAQNELPSV